jgi:hypothetical protein
VVTTHLVVFDFLGGASSEAPVPPPPSYGGSATGRPPRLRWKGRVPPWRRDRDTEEEEEEVVRKESSVEEQ